MFSEYEGLYESKESRERVEYYVLRDKVRPLLGLESCLELELISVHNNVEQIGLSVDEVQEKSSLLDEFQDVL